MGKSIKERRLGGRRAWDLCWDQWGIHDGLIHMSGSTNDRHFYISMSDSGKSMNCKLKTSPDCVREVFPEKRSFHSILMALCQGDQMICVLLLCFSWFIVQPPPLGPKQSTRGFLLVVPPGLETTSLTSTFLCQVGELEPLPFVCPAQAGPRAWGHCTLAQKYTVVLSRRLKKHTIS